MLGKLFKYDFKEMGLILVPIYLLYVGIMAAFMVLLILARSSQIVEENTLFGLLFGIVSLVAFLSMGLILVVGSLAIVYHFYRKFVTEEAYFTLTLPAKPWEHIASKLMANVVWQIITWAVFAISVFIALFASGMLDVMADSDLFDLVLSQLQIVWEESAVELNLTAGTFVLWVIYVILSIITGPLIYFASISVGQMAGKHKILASIGAFILINMLTAFVLGTVASGYMNLSATGSLVATIVETLVMSVIYLLITTSFLSHNLNLQ